MLRERIRQMPWLYGFVRCLRYPASSVRDLLGYLYACYLTARYVDERTAFPAMRFSGGLIRLCIRKERGAKLILRGKLIVQPWMGNMRALLDIGAGGAIIIENDFVIGEEVRLKVFSNATLRCGGKDRESASGITARSTVMVYRNLRIGKDALIAWDTFLTDCDWHSIVGQPMQADTILEDHIWVAMGAKILKGAHIGANSIVACQAVVTGGNYPPGSLLAGVPARVAKSAIPQWSREWPTDPPE